MKPSIKAALLSGLVFPGTGHLFLKQYRRGLLLVAITLVALAIMVRDALQQALGIVDKIQSGAIPLDPQMISQSIDTAANSAESLPATIAWLVVLACWGIGIIDAFRIGRNTDARTPS